MAKKRATKEALLTAAIGLFQKHGFENITIDDICKEIDVTKTEFYYYYKSKDELISDYFSTDNMLSSEELASILSANDYANQVLRIIETRIRHVTVLPGAMPEGQEQRPKDQGQDACDAAVLQVFPKGKLPFIIRDLKRPDSKVGHNEHLLAQGGEAKGEYPSLVIPHHADDQKRQNHAGQCIDETSCNIPDHVLPVNVRSLI